MLRCCTATCCGSRIRMKIPKMKFCKESTWVGAIKQQRTEIAHQQTPICAPFNLLGTYFMLPDGGHFHEAMNIKALKHLAVPREPYAFSKPAVVKVPYTPLAGGSLFRLIEYKILAIS